MKKNRSEHYKKIYKTIFSFSPSGIIFAKPDGTVIDANDYILSLLKIPKDKIIGLNIYKSVKNSDIIHALDKCIKIGEAYFKGSYTSVLSKKDFYIEVFFKTIPDEKGKVKYIVIFINNKTREKRIQKNLTRSKNEWKSIIDNMINLFVQTDKDGIILKCSPSTTQILGYKPYELIGRNVRTLWFDKKEHDFTKEIYLKNPKPTKNAEARFIHKNGDFLWLKFNTSPRFTEDGSYVGSDTIAMDITKQKEMEKTLLLYKNVIEDTNEGIMITNSENQIVYTNEAFSKITKYCLDEVIGKNPNILKSGLHDNKFYKKMWDDIDSKGFWAGEIWNRHKDDGIFPELLTINTIKNKKGDVENYIAIFTDISDLKKSEAEIRHMAMHDSLTNLPNRNMLSEILTHSIKSAKRQNELMALMFIDLDNFKLINDNYGHKKGDSVLIEAAKRLKLALREEDVVCRFGGDEFIVLLEHINSSKDAAKVAQKINQAIKAPFQTDDHSFYLSCSIGIALYPLDANDMEELIKNADAAMYQAKSNGKNRYSFYSLELSKKISKELSLENILRQSIEKNNFILYYQPKFSIKNSKIVGIEALVRWQSDKFGFMGPNEFIPIAEKTGLIIPMGNWILKRACLDIKEWHEKGLYYGDISVNVSGVQLEDENFSKTLKEIIKTTKINPELLKLEITETTLMGDISQWQNKLEEIRKLGIDISIDDFGTGYSSLSYLAKLPVDELKIDKSFIDDIPKDKDACVIVKAIINLAKSLGYKTVAEGVENNDQKEFLKINGCDIIQGYLYSKPVPKKELEKLFT